MKTTRWLCWLIVLLVSGCCKRVVQQRQPPRMSTKVQTTISAQAPVTIMIHGTSRTANMARFLPPLHHWLEKRVRTPRGLLHLDDLEQGHEFGKIAHVLNKRGPDLFSLNNFYFFGWSGKLGFDARRQAAEELYAAIKSLQSQPRYTHLPITLITHSHGGNVALNLARIAEEHHDGALCIERLILLACPVQDETEKYVKHSVFRRVYSFYSTADWLQVLDPQGAYRERISYHRKHKKKCSSFFSRRRFKQLSNVYQIEVRINGCKPGHQDFIKTRFYHAVPELIRLIEIENTDNQRSSNHFYELDIKDLQ